MDIGNTPHLIYFTKNNLLHAQSIIMMHQSSLAAKSLDLGQIIRIDIPFSFRYNNLNHERAAEENHKEA